MTNEPAVALPGHPIGPSRMAGNGLQVWLKECRCEMTFTNRKNCLPALPASQLEFESARAEGVVPVGTMGKAISFRVLSPRA